MRTVAEPVDTEWVRIEPAREPGIRINGVPAELATVQKADARVDLSRGGSRSFVVEHVLGPLGLSGVTAAEVVGTADEWDFSRPEHRFCYSRNDDPAQVVGHPHGLPNPAVASGVADVGIEERSTPTRHTVSEPVTVREGDGEVTLRPRDHGQGVRFEVTFRGQRFVAEVDPAGTTDPRLVQAITNSTTPFLTQSAGEGIVHSVGDLVSDIPVLGGFEDLVVEANLAGGYHALTVGASRRAHERGVVIES
jgi:hypothetical protein